MSVTAALNAFGEDVTLAASTCAQLKRLPVRMDTRTHARTLLSAASAETIMHSAGAHVYVAIVSLRVLGLMIFSVFFFFEGAGWRLLRWMVHMLFMVHAYFIFQPSRVGQPPLLRPGCCAGTWADFMSPSALPPLNKRPIPIRARCFRETPTDP